MLGDGDLSDSERRRLAEIESSLGSDDPAFVQRFAQRRRPGRRRDIVALLATGAAVIVVVIGLARDSVISAVLGLVAVGATVGVWATARRR
jgi:hypothetical protein